MSPSFAVRRRKAVSCLAIKVGSRSRRLTSPHQKCDGKRPCTTCIDRERGAECSYEPRQRSHRASATLPIRRETASRPLSVRTLPSKPPAIGFSFSGSLIRPSLGTPHLAWSDPGESASSPPLQPPLAPYERSLASSSRVHGRALGPSPDVSATQDIHSTGYVPRTTVSSFTILPSIHFRRIPRPFPVPLSLIPPERVQISSNAGGDLDMTWYVLFWVLNSHLVVGTKP